MWMTSKGEREKDRKERYRQREHRSGGEEQGRERREQERREKHGYRQHTGKTDGEERREQKRREKEQHVQFSHQDRELEIEQRHRHQDGDGAREREERDKQREKRHADSNQRHGEHESAHRKSLQGDYEEDFEEFDEDKEQEEEEEVREDERREVKRELSPHSRREVEAIQRAMEKENELLSAAHSTQESEISIRASADSESRLRNSRTYSRVIDFTAARQREINQQASDKQKKRSAELLRLIDLDFSVTECLLDLPPVREYDLYIKSYGMANTQQAYVQCNEDNIERDAQTDETDVTDKWTQHPPESSVACGGPQVSQNASDETVTRTTVDSKRLAAFLRSATQVMAVLLEENMAESNAVKKLQSQTHTHSFSDGCVQLNTKLNLLQGRQVTLLHFSQTQTHTLLSVHALHSGSSDVTLDSKTLICVWNIWEPSTPQRILVYEAEVRSCCFSPGKSTLVFAGTDVGSVLVWDLREPSGSHSHISVCEEEWTLRHATFSTDAVLSGAGHFSPVVSVEPVLVNVGAGLRDPLSPDQEESLGLSFQLGSLDENGLLNLWVVVELPKADDSGSQTDLGEFNSVLTVPFLSSLLCPHSSLCPSCPYFSVLTLFFLSSILCPHCVLLVFTLHCVLPVLTSLSSLCPSCPHSSVLTLHCVLPVLTPLSSLFTVSFLSSLLTVSFLSSLLTVSFLSSLLNVSFLSSLLSVSFLSSLLCPHCVHPVLTPQCVFPVLTPHCVLPVLTPLSSLCPPCPPSSLCPPCPPSSLCPPCSHSLLCPSCLLSSLCLSCPLSSVLTVSFSGLRPGGKVKLLHSSSLWTTPRMDKGVLGVTSHLSFVLKFLPSDSNHYFIGSNMGLVRHGTRHGLRAVPKLYRPKGGEKPADVTALEFSPTGEPFFLVGCSDGSVRLHALVCDEAVCEWTVGSGHGSVQCVQSSPTRCSVFCALDSTSVLCIWDLTQRDESPFITQDLHTDPASAMAVFGDASKQNPYSGIALAKHSGRLEVHFLLPSLTLPQASDAEKLHSLTRDTL
ncbi:hypothetical protein QTP70_016053 [Hemibagrus guttatus]|uniref:WD repeat domain 60 n=1 Tax=Hemibagrus guttatus TaxID=175788 RepID=A0AAE0R6P1_9TELE|nr:hypothetical protein QTP70_016053 [Hemibagrus guttatus]